MGELRFDREMSDAEAMMWRIERDPWLAPSGGSITIFDRPIDVARFRRLMAHAVSEVPRLRHHVVEPRTPLGRPHWEVDRELDLDWHVRHIGAPGAGTLRDLLDWTTVFLQDPYDRTRPLWQYVVIDKLADGRGALAMKLHHTVTDGHGAVRLAKAYTAYEPDAPDPPEVDLVELLATDTAGSAPVGDQVRSAIRTPVGAAQALVDALTHPDRLAGLGRGAGDLARTAAEQQHPAGSRLWTSRSRRRHLEALSLAFDEVRAAAKGHDATVNDVFVAGAVEAAVRYHDVHGVPLEHLHITFVVSTRHDGTSGRNAFTPVPVDLPAGPMTPAERVASVRDRLRERRGGVHGDGAIASLSTVANLLPVPLVTSVVRAQAAHIDFATSNLPGFLGDSWVAGARTEHTYVFGPVAGTPFNLTAYSTAGRLDLGLQVDPAAVTDPGLLRRCLKAAYRDLLAG